MPSDDASAGWFDRPMRWAQLTLAENDPAAGQYDVDFWLDYFKRAKCDAACLTRVAACVIILRKFHFTTKLPLWETGMHTMNYMKAVAS